MEVMAVTNALAYNPTILITVAKTFTVQVQARLSKNQVNLKGSRANVTKPFRVYLRLWYFNANGTLLVFTREGSYLNGKYQAQVVFFS